MSVPLVVAGPSHAIRRHSRGDVTLHYPLPGLHILTYTMVTRPARYNQVQLEANHQSYLRAGPDKRQGQLAYDSIASDKFMINLCNTNLSLVFLRAVNARNLNANVTAFGDGEPFNEASSLRQRFNNGEQSAQTCQ